MNADEERNGLLHADQMTVTEFTVSCLHVPMFTGVRANVGGSEHESELDVDVRERRVPIERRSEG
jgi:hypothetical protein